ncbi:hypothetical protein [Aeromicrobium sp.]|uniref:hypothetical protein n=1 Tax=Aeromicrobium sp. TaxID=1871063 RepID=UPI003C569507
MTALVHQFWHRALTAVAVAVAAIAITAQSASATPVPPDPRNALLTPYLGHPAIARPTSGLTLPQHPFMARNGANNIHNDAYQSDAYNGPGPLGKNPKVTSTLYANECASVTFDRAGRIVTVCVGVAGASLKVLDPTTLGEIASYDLPPRKLGSFSFSNFSGGGYFYLDHLDRAVVSTSTGHIFVIAVKGSTLTLKRDIDVSKVTGGAGIQSALPDWAGRIWFVTTEGLVAMIDSKGVVHPHQLPTGETIANSFAMDESGGVFIVSDAALYRFDVVRSRPKVTWRKSYDRGSRVKPGQVSQGSGTTPTLIGSASSPGGGSIAITDNADPRMNVLVFRRGKGGPGAKPLCKQPVFPADQSNDENSLISVPGGLIAENNYGYSGPLPAGATTRIPDTTPGLVRIDVNYKQGGCRIAWSNTTARVPSVVSKVNLKTGLIYTYTHPAANELSWKLAPLPDLLAPDAWYFSALDLRSGKHIWSQLTGSGLGYNNNYAPISLGRDGAAYVGTLGGLVRVADTR